jgi:acetyl-CoA synthetase
MSSAQAFITARDFLLKYREDYDKAYRDFHWPALDRFNWALDYFDTMAMGNERPALQIVGEDHSETVLSFAQLSARSNQAANYLRAVGVQRGDRVLLMLGNVVPLWEVILAAIKLGAVIIPSSTLLNREDLVDRLTRGRIAHVIAGTSEVAKFADIPGSYGRITVGSPVQGWQNFDAAYAAPDHFAPDGETKASDPLLLYFTSGTTAKPKLVVHTHASYPVGHLSTMYWLGLRPDDVHLNISSPGWAKHAWSCVFAPWNAGATVFIHAFARFSARHTLETIARWGVTSLCAPPTVWRLLVQEDIAGYKVKLRSVAGAGEPLNPEVIEKVRRAWGLTIRDGYGQTETTAQIANTPGQRVKPGSMGRPLPGYRLVLLDAEGRDGQEGQICLRLKPSPLGLMTGYEDDPARTSEIAADDIYRTGDVALVDEEGYLTYVGRADDIFKSSDYRISPFELESVLIEHAAVAEAAVVPSPDPLRLAVPKAFIALVPGIAPTRETALAIFRHIDIHLAPYKRIRRIEFGDLPKTISGKIRRVDLRRAEETRSEVRRANEYWKEDFPELALQ